MVSSSDVGRGRGAALGCGLVLFAILAVGCGDATCPSGSKSMGGQCVPAAECGEGMVRKGDTCERTSGIDADDAGHATDDGEGQSGGKAPGTADAGSGGTGGERDGGLGADAAAGDSTDAAVEVPEACVDYDCGAHGHCEVASDAPRCACDTGFAGEHCESCEPGMSLEGETCVPACEVSDAPDCGAHGSCEVIEDGTHCACESGYSGDHCEACEPGLGHAGMACVPACEADDAPDCGANGACEVVDGVAQCTCTYPHAGALCTQCAPHFALQDDGTCAPDCGDCGPHGFCDGNLMVPECACYAGYVRENRQCTWSNGGETGGIVNGVFEGASGWTHDHANIAANTVTFSPSGTGSDCEVGALEQTITMPTREQSEPLMLVVGTKTACTSTDPEACPPLLIEFGSSVTRLRVPGRAGGGFAAWYGICLGDVAYGGQVKFRIRPGVARIPNPFAPPSAGWPCNTQWPTVTDVQIRAAAFDECAAPGTIPNGNFDAGTADNSWTLSPSGASIAGGVLSVGDTGFASVRFTAPAANAVASPAIHIALRPESGDGALLVELDGMQLSTIRESASTTSTTRYVCLPDWALGAAHDLTLRAFATNMLIDNVEVDHDERCGDNSFDRGFERPLEAGGWFIHSSGGPDAKVVSDSRAFAGHGSLSVQNTLLGAAMRFPETASGAHAALSWAARVGTSQMSGSVSPRGVAPALNTTIPTSSPTWAITTVCAGHIWDGQLAQLIVSASASLGSGATGTPEILLDEFGPSSSSGCP